MEDDGATLSTIDFTSIHGTIRSCVGGVETVESWSWTRPAPADTEVESEGGMDAIYLVKCDAHGFHVCPHCNRGRELTFPIYDGSVYECMACEGRYVLDATEPMLVTQRYYASADTALESELAAQVDTELE